MISLSSIGVKHRSSDEDFPALKKTRADKPNPVNLYHQYISAYKDENYAKFALNEAEINHPAMHEVVYPLLVSRNFIIRPPRPCEHARLKKVLDISPVGDSIFNDVLDEDEANIEITKRFGVYVKEDGRVHRLYFIEHVPSQSKNKPKGVIHFSFKDNKCYVHGLEIRPKGKRQGLGTALMSMAFKVALAQKCFSVHLSSSSSSGIFYIDIGYIPLGANYDIWEKLDYLQKLKIITFGNNLFELDLTIEKARKVAESRLQLVLKADYTSKPKDEEEISIFELRKIPLPEVVMEWDCITLLKQQKPKLYEMLAPENIEGPTPPLDDL